MPVIETAVKSFSTKKVYAYKMLWINNLIHAFQSELNAGHKKPGLAYRPAAWNFIKRKVLCRKQ